MGIFEESEHKIRNKQAYSFRKYLQNFSVTNHPPHWDSTDYGWFHSFPQSVWGRRGCFSHLILRLTALQNEEKHWFLFKGCSFYHSPRTKIKCCPDSRFPGSIYVRYNDRRCSFGPHTHSHTLKLWITMRHVLHKPSLEEQLRAVELKGWKAWSSGYGRQTIFPIATLNILLWKNVTDKATFAVRSAGAPGWQGFSNTSKGRSRFSARGTKRLEWGRIW